MKTIGKTRRMQSVLIVLSLVIFTLSLDRGWAIAGDYLGEYRWKLYEEPKNTQYVILKLAVTHMGDDHNLVNGTATNFENGVQKNIDVVHGNSEITGSTTTMTLINSYFVPSTEYGYSAIQIQIDSSTLNGTYRTIDTAYQFSSGQITQEFGQGSIEFLSKSDVNPIVKGDFDGNGKLGLEDSIGILQILSGARLE